MRALGGLRTVLATTEQVLWFALRTELASLRRNMNQILF